MVRSNNALWLVLLSSRVFAYELEATDSGTPLRWDAAQVVYSIETVGMPSMHDMDPAEPVRAAFATWDEASIELSFAEEDAVGTNDPDLLLDDGRNQVFWPSRWDADRDVLAHTSIRFSPDGTIVEADVLLNPRVRWTVVDHPGNGVGQHDLENTVTHEIGHAIGLAHTEVDEATMYASSPPGETRKRDLATDDVEGVRFLYPQVVPGVDPVVADDSDAPATRAGCSALPMGPSPAGAWAFVLLLTPALVGRGRGRGRRVLARVRVRQYGA